MASAISAVFHAICAPFSPLRRGSDDDSGGNNNNRGSDDEGDDADEVDGDDDGDDADEVDGDDDGDEAGAAPVAVSTGKRKRGEKSTTTKLGTLTREAKKLMSDDALCRYFQGRLENIAITGCGSQTCNNCLRVLKTTEICLLVADFLVWFERKHKIDQDGIVQMMIVAYYIQEGDDNDDDEEEENMVLYRDDDSCILHTRRRRRQRRRGRGGE